MSDEQRTDETVEIDPATVERLRAEMRMPTSDANNVDDTLPAIDAAAAGAAIVRGRASLVLEIAKDHGIPVGVALYASTVLSTLGHERAIAVINDLAARRAAEAAMAVDASDDDSDGDDE